VAGQINEYFGITLERAAKILDALNVRLRTQVATIAAVSRCAGVMTVSLCAQHGQTFPRERFHKDSVNMV